MSSSNVRLCQVYKKKNDRQDVTVLYLCIKGEKKGNSGQVESAYNVQTRVNHSHWMTDLHRLAPWRAPSRLSG